MGFIFETQLTLAVVGAIAGLAIGHAIFGMWGAAAGVPAGFVLGFFFLPIPTSSEKSLRVSRGCFAWELGGKGRPRIASESLGLRCFRNRWRPPAKTRAVPGLRPLYRDGPNAPPTVLRPSQTSRFAELP